MFASSLRFVALFLLSLSQSWSAVEAVRCLWWVFCLCCCCLVSSQLSLFVAQQYTRSNIASYMLRASRALSKQQLVSQYQRQRIMQAGTKSSEHSDKNTRCSQSTKIVEAPPFSQGWPILVLTVFDVCLNASRRETSIFSRL